MSARRPPLYILLFLSRDKNCLAIHDIWNVMWMLIHIKEVEMTNKPRLNYDGTKIERKWAAMWYIEKCRKKTYSAQTSIPKIKLLPAPENVFPGITPAWTSSLRE